jgi:hypothetical protein
MVADRLDIIEIDMAFCTRTFGAGGCTAALGLGVPRKCYNTFGTCKAPAAFISGTKTLRFSQDRGNLPVGPVIFPALVSVSAISASVNIAGSDASLSAFGRRASISIELQDFPYHERDFDPYQPERITGAAQIDEGGYDPATRGTFLAKLLARWPHYAGRALRRISGRLVAGAFVADVTRHYVITSFSLPDDRGRVTVEASDILDLASNERAVAPRAGEGYLSQDMALGAASVTLTPSGIGAKYPTGGRAVIGSELIAYTRAGDVVTFTARAGGGTKQAAHSAGDTFQPVLSVGQARIDFVARALLVDYAGVPAAYIPTAKWAAEIDTWAADVLLSADICAPVSVASLVGELAVLGISIWWDDALREIGLKVNRSPYKDPIIYLSENAQIKSLEIVSKEEARLTEILFYTVQSDVTKSATSAENFDRLAYTADFNAKDSRAYGDTRTRKIFCRWLNAGNDNAALVMSNRLLKRFSRSPMQIKLTLDKQSFGIGLADVISIDSKSIQDETGNNKAALFQVISRSEDTETGDIFLTAQAYQFNGKYGAATVDTMPYYLQATEAQRSFAEFACDNTTLLLPDGSAPYEAI